MAVVDRDRGILAERSEPNTRTHAEVIGTFIAECLAEAGVAESELSGVALGMGPGPFTGLRVGIAAGRVFAFGASMPSVPVVSHDAIAFGCTAPTLVVTDARRREVYWSVYSGSDAQGIPVRTAGPALAKPDDLPAVVPGYADLARIDAAEVSAGALGMLAEALLANGRALAADEALYLRAPDVTLSAGPKRVSQ